MNKPEQIHIFDRHALQKRQARTAQHFGQHDVLFEETAVQLMDRLKDVKKIFSSVLFIGAQSKKIQDAFKDCERVTHLQELNVEEVLPFSQNSFDLVVTNWWLHWINDLPGVFIQIGKILKPDGLFLAAFPGGKTLHELRSCLLDAELAVSKGVSPRLSSMIELSSATALMQRAGFELPVIDSEILTLTYPDAFTLMRDLRGMGESNAHQGRLRHFTKRRVLFEAARLYQERFAGKDGKISATFEIIFLHGWKP